MFRKKNTLYALLWNIKNRILSLTMSKTVGARALIIRGEEVLLIKHTYQEGWYTIGGGVESGESPLEAIVRELSEEVGIKPKSSLQLMGVYHSTNEKRDDYVALYIVKDFTMSEVQCAEILDKRWFNLAVLPPDVTPATKRRIEEYLGLREQSDKW